MGYTARTSQIRRRKTLTCKQLLQKRAKKKLSGTQKRTESPLTP
jgi:hypothetical protein